MFDYKKIIFKVIIIGIVTILANNSLRAQEIPVEDRDETIIDTIDYGENLLDSNEVYKKQFDSLSKDGEWVETKKSDLIRDLTNNTGEEYDIFPEEDNIVYVWRPFGVNNYWTPYTNGCWEFSNCGWVWTSYYSWGWGPYNYGRWYCSSYYGWIWFPGCVWAPNWVTWRCSGQYVGWYPSCPQVYWTCGLQKQIYTNHLFAYNPRNWVFVNKKDFPVKVDNTTIVKSEQNIKLLKESKKIETATYSDPSMPKFKYNGPDAEIVAAASGSEISPMHISVKHSGGREVAEYISNPASEREEDTKIRETSTAPNSSSEETTVGKKNEERKKYDTKETKDYGPPAEINAKKSKEKVKSAKPPEKTVKTKTNKDSNKKSVKNENKKNGSTKNGNKNNGKYRSGKKKSGYSRNDKLPGN